MSVPFCSPRLPALPLSDVLRIWGSICGFCFFVVALYFPNSQILKFLSKRIGFKNVLKGHFIPLFSSITLLCFFK